MDSGRHEICVEGVLDQRWSGRVRLAADHQPTRPRDVIADQAAPHGPLTKTCDLHLSLAWGTPHRTLVTSTR